MLIWITGFVVGVFVGGCVVHWMKVFEFRHMYADERARADALERMLDDARAQVEMLGMGVSGDSRRPDED